MERGENKESCETFVKYGREHAESMTNERELMTVQEMIDAKVPMEKIHAIVAKGGGVADADCPELLALTQFWVTRKRARTITDTSTQRSETTVQAETDMSVFGLPDPIVPTRDPGAYRQTIQQVLVNAGNFAASGSGGTNTGVLGSRVY